MRATRTAAALGVGLVCAGAVTAQGTFAGSYGEGACAYTDNSGEVETAGASGARAGAVAHSADDVPGCTEVSSPWVSHSGVFPESLGWAIYCTDDAPYNWNYVATHSYGNSLGGYESSTTGGAGEPEPVFTTADNTMGSSGDPGKADWYSTIWFSGSFMYSIGCSSDSSASASASALSHAAGSARKRKLVRERALRPNARVVHKHRCPGGRKLKSALHGVGYFTKEPPDRVRHTTKLSTTKRRLKVVAKTRDISRGQVRLQTQIQCGSGRVELPALQTR